MNTEPMARRVLLIGWDAADWDMIDPLIEAGRMPNMKRFVDEGVRGNVASLAPMLSPILWTSIATGKRADKHDILGFVEPDGTTGRLRPVSSTSRKCKAIWNILSDQGKRAGAINWYASHPAERVNGFIVTDRFAHATAPPDQPWPAVPHSVHPAEHLDALASIRLHPSRTSREQVAAFVQDLHAVEGRDLDRCAELRSLLAHCSTVHAAATALMQDEDWEFLGVYYDAIDRFAHAFMEFHPPCRDGVDETSYAHFCGVMQACYEFHDMMLGRLMKLAGDHTCVIILSDHGFHSGERRPAGTSAIKDGQPVSWHRPYGVIAMWGPGIRQGEQIYGASLLDVAPTILATLGLPVPRDMDGSALIQVFDSPHAIEHIDTYEDGTPHDAGDAEDEDPWVAEQMLRQLRDLGYVGDDDVQAAAVDRLRNLAQVYASTGRHEHALRCYDELLAMSPDERGMPLARASTLMALGRLDECEATLATADDSDQATLLLGMVAFRKGRDDEAIDILRPLADSGALGVASRLGAVYVRRGMLDEAKTAFESALALDPEDAEALDGLGVVYREEGKPADAVLAHMRSIALLHYRPQSHINLGLALAQVGRVRWAVRAFEVALGMDANLPIAHRALSELWSRAFKNQERADFHRRLADELARSEPRS